MSARDLLLASAFELTSTSEGGGPAFTDWGRFATGGFDAEVDDAKRDGCVTTVRLDGDVTTALLGADAGTDRWLAGVAVAVSEGDGTYDHINGEENGEIESSLTTLLPYAKIALNNRVDFWGTVGVGSGDMTLTRAMTDTASERHRTDLSVRMGAVGLRGDVLQPSETNPMALTMRSDAFWVRTESDRVDGPRGKLEGAEADVSRLRLILEGSRPFAMGSGTFTPSAEVGLRHDAGDAETGTGVEFGGGLRYEGDGFSIEGSARTLVAHEADGYDEWGASGSIRINPGASGSGLSLTVAPTWGAAGSNVEGLWGLKHAEEQEVASLKRRGGSRPKSVTESGFRATLESSPPTRDSRSVRPATAHGGPERGGRSLRRSHSDSKRPEARQETATSTIPSRYARKRASEGGGQAESD